MIDNEKDIRDDEFRVITHSDFHKDSSRIHSKKRWWILVAIAAVALLAMGLLFL